MQVSKTCISVGISFTLQEQLKLDVSGRWASRWCSSQWQLWKQYHLVSKLPTAALQQGRQQATAKEQEALLEFPSASTVAVLALLLRWQSNLKDTAKDRARSLLAEFLGATLQKDWRMCINSSWQHEMLQDAWPVVHDDISISCQDGVVELSSWWHTIPHFRHQPLRHLT